MPSSSSISATAAATAAAALATMKRMKMRRKWRRDEGSGAREGTDGLKLKGRVLDCTGSTDMILQDCLRSKRNTT